MDTYITTNNHVIKPEILMVTLTAFSTWFLQENVTLNVHFHLFISKLDFQGDFLLFSVYYWRVSEWIKDGRQSQYMLFSIDAL